jgi:hypothetical protein
VSAVTYRCNCPIKSELRGPTHAHDCPLFSTGQEASRGPEQPSVEALRRTLNWTWEEWVAGREQHAAALDSLTAAYREMEKDRDEWERRYSELLEAVGGTWPG